MTTLAVVPAKPIELHLTVLGRTLEHLGVQMYKRREPAIAELIANSWDAGAKQVKVIVPEKDAYDPDSSSITIEDDGSGMSSAQIQNEYLVVGRNRRAAGGSVAGGRALMGRKGIGKLAGFGIASSMELTTWQDQGATTFTLNVEKLKADDDVSQRIAIPAETMARPEWALSLNGTRLILRGLKHSTAIDVQKLREALARRFSLKVRGEMEIRVNGDLLGDPDLPLGSRTPDAGVSEAEVAPGQKVKYYYGFSKETIKSPEMRGFTIYAHGKTAQAPPFFFNVEGTASGQHSTKYLTGAIEADFLDDSPDEKKDVISTDRQDIDWEAEQAKPLLKWGAALTRRALIECAAYKGKEVHDWILSEPAIKDRVDRLDSSSRKQVSRFLTILGQSEPDKERGLELGDAIVRAFEYRHFHDVINEMDEAAADPEKFYDFVSKLQEWKVLESRAVLEILEGRLQIVDRLRQMIIEAAPETASKLSKENFHDLIGGYPWILNPEWNIFEEEKSLSTILTNWGVEDVKDEDERLRIDFLALTDTRELVVVELKRPHHAVSSDELFRLMRYRENLTKAFKGPVRMLLVHGGTLDASTGTQDSFRNTSGSEILTWAEIYARSRDYYEHYRAVLKGDVGHSSFVKKTAEVLQTRKHLTGVVYRSPSERKQGLGPQDKEVRTLKIGIIAFGSLLFDLGQDLQEQIVAEQDVITPFRVEYARSSTSRGGAPTLVPSDAGSQVKAKVFVLKQGLDLQSACALLEKREGGGATKAGVDIAQIPDFAGLDVAIFARNSSNITPDSSLLASLAIKSVKQAPQGKDGVTYLNEMLKLGVTTPLTADYQAEILKSTQSSDLETALKKLLSLST